MGVAATSALLMQYLAHKAGSLRKQAGVPYPYLYAERSEAEKSPIKNLYNCHQRAHQNTLESYPGFLVLLATASITHPLFAAASGAVWIVGKFFYAQGYYTGDPKKRLRGTFAYFGLFGLLGASLKTVAEVSMGW
ncbi:hypothetical protein DFJ77DRAFT_428880 [Powellomyces hirtus]|nr:hypothetical protein DFJ77DRAFT_428880 [Powellomyces hirtus]